MGFSPGIQSWGHAVLLNNPWLAAGNVYIDPQNSTTFASDANDGLSAITPLLTWAEALSRYGGNPEVTFPFAQGLTIHLLSPQTAGVDPIFLRARMSGGAQLILDCRAAWVAAGADFAAGALGGSFGSAGAAPSAGGTPMTIAGAPAYAVAGTLLQNTARGNETCVVKGLAAGTATVGQPQTLASLTTTTAVPQGSVVANDWVAGDNIHVVTLPLVNLKDFRIVGGDLTAGGQPCSAWVIGANVADSSGNGGSEFGIVNEGAMTVYSMCAFSPRVHFGSQQGRGTSGMNFLCCFFAQNVVPYMSAVLAGCVLAAGITVNAGTTQLQCNTCVSGSSTLNPGTNVVVVGGANGSAWSDAAWTVGVLSGIGVTGFFHGSYAITLLSQATYINNTGSTFVLKAALTTGALKIGTATTGSTYIGAGVMADGVNITPANIDAGGAGGAGIFNVRTGARFTNPQ